MKTTPNFKCQKCTLVLIKQLMSFLLESFLHESFKLFWIIFRLSRVSVCWLGSFACFSGCLDFVACYSDSCASCLEFTTCSSSCSTFLASCFDSTSCYGFLASLCGTLTLCFELSIGCSCCAILLACSFGYLACKLENYRSFHKFYKQLKLNSHFYNMV